MPHLARGSRSALRGAALIAAFVTIVGTSAAAFAAPAGHAISGAAASAVPWRQVGPGWSIAEYSASSAPAVTPRVKGPTTLYAVSPLGHKYAFYHWPATVTGEPKFIIVDWSGDKQRVLVRELAVPTSLEQISLVTGKVISKFSLPTHAGAIGYTRPDGLNVLAERSVGGRIEVIRYDLTGHLQRVLLSAPRLTGAIDAPDGKTVIVGTTSGLEQVSNLGGVTKRMHVPAAVESCNPLRWWNSRTVLGNCFAKSKGGGSKAGRLWLFPVGGGKVTALTGQRNGSGPDLGDIDAWKLTSGVYLQAIGPCGTQFIAKQYRNGSVHVVTVPGTSDNNRIVTGLRARLLVWSISECLGGNSLLWFNPGTNSVRYAIHAPTHILGVFDAIPYGRPLS